MNDELYIFGGYNGLSSDKLYHQNTSSNWCAMFSTNVTCNKVSNCVWCVDIASSRAGCYVSNTHSHLSCSPTSNVCQNARYARSEASVWTLSTDVCIASTVPGDCSSCMQGKLVQGVSKKFTVGRNLLVQRALNVSMGFSEQAVPIYLEHLCSNIFSQQMFLT